MLVGETFYYTMRRDGSFFRQAGFDPCGVRPREIKCSAREVAVWSCTNGERFCDVYVGSSVRKRYPSDGDVLAALGF